LEKKGQPRKEAVMKYLGGNTFGVGHATNSNSRWFVRGEVVHIEIEEVGIYSNPIVDEQ